MAGPFKPKKLGGKRARRAAKKAAPVPCGTRGVATLAGVTAGVLLVPAVRGRARVLVTVALAAAAGLIVFFAGAALLTS